MGLGLVHVLDLYIGDLCPSSTQLMDRGQQLQLGYKNLWVVMKTMALCGYKKITAPHIEGYQSGTLNLRATLVNRGGRPTFRSLRRPQRHRREMPKASSPKT